MSTRTDVGILIAAGTEWRPVREALAPDRVETSPFGEYFFAHVDSRSTLFFHSGWGKVAAAAASQHLIDRFAPDHIINIGTCGGIAGRVNRFDVVAAERTLIYDIYERMGDAAEATAHYATELTVPAKLPASVLRTTIYTADSDLLPAQLRELEKRFRPSVVDWESGAIAWVAKRNRVPLLIVRGVSDLVSIESAEAEGNIGLFQKNARLVMQGLLRDLPLYVGAALES